MRVLLIESEHKIARVTKDALTQEGFDVDLHFDADSASKAAVAGEYDIAIVDVAVSTNKDGLAIVKSIREAKIHAPVLLLGNAKKASERTAELNSGADEYLLKPFGLENLIAKVYRLLHHPSSLETTMTFADIVLDNVTFEVRRAGKLVPLTSKEFGLLKFMMRNPGRPLSKEVLINHVWDYDADILPNTVEVYIKYLRNKIDEPFDKQLIKTLRGFGYKLEA